MTFTINPDDWKKVLAEVVGTFFFFFIGIGTYLFVGANDAFALFLVALAHGLGLALAISALGHVSGGHFNPAVTIAMLVTRRINPLLSLFYIIGQIAGGVAACLALIVFVPKAGWEAVHLGTPQITTTIVDGNQAVFIEAVLTFFLVLSIFGTAVDPRGPKLGGFAIGLTMMAGIITAGALTGGIVNPARAIAPAIVSGFWQDDQIVYWIGPIVGAVIAALIYQYIFMPRPSDEVVATATVPELDETLEPPMSEPNLAGSTREK